MSHFSAPGKLMIAGEWAVLEGSPCIVAAVNRRVHAIVEEGRNISISLDDFGLQDLKFSWDGKALIATEDYQAHAEKLKFTKEAIEVSLRFLEQNGIKAKPFSMRTYGEDTNVGDKKVGFGSSAAAVVAIIASILDFHGYRATKEEIYKLAAIAHYYAQGKAGSAFDVAASTYGGIIVYRRFDAAWLTNKMESNERIAGIVKEGWPGFYVEGLNIPENFLLAIAWTGESASTTVMMKQMASFKQTKPNRYVDIYDGIQHVVERIIGAWKSGNDEQILDGLRKNRALLRQLTDESGVGIETPQLKRLAEIAERFGTAGKLSGAGGGDCGFAISFDKSIIENVKSELQKAGLHNIDAGIDKDGAKAVQMEQIILVDSSDREIGYEEKEKCHSPPKLHRAFSVFLFNDAGEMLITQRSPEKKTWPLFWSNACCSHPRKGESCEAAAKRRVKEELGIDCAPEFLFKFEYSAQYDDKWGEHELDWVFSGKSDGPVNPDRNEVSDWKFVGAKELEKDVRQSPDKYTPWFKTALERVLGTR